MKETWLRKRLQKAGQTSSTANLLAQANDRARLKSQLAAHGVAELAQERSPRWVAWRNDIRPVTGITDVHSF